MNRVAPSPAAAAGRQPPNILLFLADDQRWDTIRALGHDIVRTPALDALVRRGTAFTQAHIPGGTCGAICMPSRAMLHTGRTLFRIDGEGQEIAADKTTIGECLRRAGYETFGVGKWHNGRAAFARAFSGGDKIFFGGMADHWNVPVYRFDPAGQYAGRCPFIADPWRSNRKDFRECDHIVAGKHSTELLVEAAIRLLGRRDRRRPFFLHLALLAPHDPRSAPDDFLRLYDPRAIPLPENFLAAHPIDTGALGCRDELLAAFPRRPDEIRRHIAEYYAMISHLDAGLGRLLAAMERSGDIGNTIVVATGDNGLALGQHGLMGKQNLYQHSVRVPLILAGPGIPGGERREALVYLLDIFPTLCELAGTAIPPSVEGLSLLPLLRDARTALRDTLYLAYEASIRGVTDGRFKLIEYACGRTQFFDLRQDPAETRDLSPLPSARAGIARMRRQLVRHAGAWDDKAHPAGRAFWAARPDLDAAGAGKTPP